MAPVALNEGKYRGMHEEDEEEHENERTPPLSQNPKANVPNENTIKTLKRS